MKSRKYKFLNWIWYCVNVLHSGGNATIWVGYFSIHWTLLLFAIQCIFLLPHALACVQPYALQCEQVTSVHMMFFSNTVELEISEKCTCRIPERWTCTACHPVLVYFKIFSVTTWTKVTQTKFKGQKFENNTMRWIQIILDQFIFWNARWLIRCWSKILPNSVTSVCVVAFVRLLSWE